MKRLALLLAVIAFFAGAGVAHAIDTSAALYSGLVRITNNSTAATNVAVPFTANSSVYIADGYMNDSANNTGISSSSGADVFYMPGLAGNAWIVQVPSIGENNIQNDTLFMGGATDMNGLIRYFPGSAGMTVPDDTTLEPGDNFTVSSLGFFDTSTGADKNIFIKRNGVRAYVSPTVADNVTFEMDTGQRTLGEFVDNFSTDQWTDTGTKIVVNTTEQRLDYESERSGTDTRTAFDLTTVTTVSETSWRLDYTLQNITSVNAAGEFVFGIGSDNENENGYSGAAIFMRITGTTPTVRIVTYNGTATSASDQINIDNNVGYFVSLERIASDNASLSVFTDIDRTTHLSGSPVTIALSSNVSGLQFLLASNADTGAGASFEQIGFIDDLIFNPDPVRISALNISSSNHTIITAITDRPDFDDWATDASVLVPFGGGVLPVFLLEEQEVTTATTTITFSDIDDLVSKLDTMNSVTTRHLVVVANAASDLAANTDDMRMRFNADTGSNYNTQILLGDGGSALAVRETTTRARAGTIPGTSVSDGFGGGVILIPHAFNTANHKSVISLVGSAERRISVTANRWADTSAITSLELFLASGDFISGSVFQLGVVDERYLVEEVNLSSSDNITFSTVPSGGNDLVAIGYLRGNRAASTDDFVHNINGDTTAGNYLRQELTGSASSTSANSLSNNSIGGVVGNTGGANAFNAFVAFYSAYAEGTNDPTVLVLSGYDNAAGTSVARVTSGRRNNVAAITSLEYAPTNSSAFVSDSMASLYRVPRTVIARVEVTSTGNVTLSNIPQTYEALQIVMHARTNRAFGLDGINITINGDTTAANYDTQELTGAGASVTSGRNAATQNIGTLVGDTAGANEFGSEVITIPQYAKTDRHKHLIGVFGANEDIVGIISMRWENTDNISVIKLEARNGTGLLAGTIIELVGLMPSRTMHIDVDGTIRAITPAAGMTILDNSENWTFFQNNAMQFVETANVSIDGILAGSWEWSLASTFPDGSANSNTGTPSFRSASTDADVSAVLVDFLPITEAKAPISTVNITTAGWITANLTQTGNFTTTTNATYPLSDVVVDVTDAGSVPVQLFELLMAGIVVLSLSLLISWVMRTNREGSLFFKILVITAGLGIMTAVSIVDEWILYLFLMISVAIAMGASQRTFNGTGNSGNNMIGFLAMSFFGMTSVNRFLEGRLIQSSDVDLLRNTLAFQPFEVFGLFTIPVPNSDFLLNGIPALMRWDHSYFGGNAQIFQYMLYSVTTVVSFMLFVLVFGAIYQMFSRR